jgi:hypothetical protein
MSDVGLRSRYELQILKLEILCILREISRPRAGRIVATSVSEWKSIHSRTLAATTEMRRVERIWHRGGSIKCPAATRPHPLALSPRERARIIMLWPSIAIPGRTRDRYPCIHGGIQWPCGREVEILPLLSSHSVSLPPCIFFRRRAMPAVRFGVAPTTP